MSCDTPDNTGKTPDQKRQRLNGKLRLAAGTASGRAAALPARSPSWPGEGCCPAGRGAPVPQPCTDRNIE